MDDFSNYQSEDFVRINVSGMLYETLKSTLARFPLTLLGDEERRKKYFVKSKNAYFFDRHRQCFESILYYYQSSGLLIRPHNVDMFLFAEESSFYGLTQKNKAMAFFADDENQAEIDYLTQNNWKSWTWKLFEHPSSSSAAKILAIWTFFVIISSITVFCIETMPYFHGNVGRGYATAGNSSLYEPTHRNSLYMDIFSSIELGCIIWFTFEFIIRLIASPDKYKFFKSFLNVIDLAAILPYYISMTMKRENFTSLLVIRVVRSARVFRVFKLSRHSMGLKVLGQTLKASGGELSNILFFVMIAIIILSSGMYYVEHDVNDQFSSIPATFWFSITTLKTIGYGDMVPVTFLGKVIGCICSVSGLLTVAIPVPIIVSNFKLIYKKDDMKYRKRAMAATNSHDPSRIS